MFKKIWDFIKKIFGNDINNNISTKKNVNKSSNKSSFKRKNNGSITVNNDSSQNSTTIEHQTVNNVIKQVISANDDLVEDDDFVFKARWYYYIPTKVVRGGVLLNDNECIVPNLSLHCNSPQDGRAGIYMLFKKANKVYNLKIIRIHIKLESFEYINNSYNKEIFGILNTDYAVNISDEKMEEGNGTFTILLQYEKNDKIFRQLFEFEMFNNARYFVIKHYNKPMLVKSE